MPPEKAANTFVLLASDTTPRWTLYFNGAANGLQGGVGPREGASVVLMEPGGQLYLHAYSLSYFCKNNSTKYEALLLGLTLVVELKVKHLLVYGDSLLVIQQTNGDFEIWEAHLIVYNACIARMRKNFEDIQFKHVPKLPNCIADELAMLDSKIVDDSTLDTPFIWFSRQDVLVESLLPSCAPKTTFVLEVYSDWYGHIVNFLAHSRLPKDCHKARDVHRVAIWHVLEDGILFRRGLDCVLLWCLIKKESLKPRRKHIKVLVESTKMVVVYINFS